MTLSNKKEKRLQTLMRKLTFIDKITMDGLPDWTPRNSTRAEYYEVYYLADLKGWSVDTLKVEWTKAKRVTFPDPVVLKPIKGGYLILTAWGDEASDELVVNQKFN